MSHAEGRFKLNDRYYYYEYDGTSDIVCTRIYENQEELHKHWRKDNSAECNCKIQEIIPVTLETSYGVSDVSGDGFEELFKSDVCMRCMAITGKTQQCEY